MTINLRGDLWDLSTPRVMGILNCTSDSFFDGGKYKSHIQLYQRIDEMVELGVDIIDIGGQSTRPGAELLESTEEWENIKPALVYIFQNYPNQIFSLDSFWSETHRKAADYGLALVNDISAGNIDSNMFPTVSDLQLPYILMHMLGNPKTMQKQPIYETVINLNLNQFFSQKLNELESYGVNDIIIDPGFGFGKTVSHNFEILNQLKSLCFGDYPILVGLSRKSMIYKSLEVTSEEALNGTTALNMLALQQGASIVRVHDIKEAQECIALFMRTKAP